MGARGLPARLRIARRFHGSYRTTLLTEETSPRLDPGVAERKYYVAGVGDVKEQAVRGNHELIRLISVTR